MSKSGKIILSPPYTVRRSVPGNTSNGGTDVFEAEQVYTHPDSSVLYTLRDCYVTHYGPILNGLRLAPVLTSQMKEKPFNLLRIYLSCFKKILLKKVRTVDKKCIVVHNNYINNYYHWVTEVFFRLYLVRHLLTDHVLILPKPRLAYQQDMLRLLNIDEASIEEVEPENLVKATEAAVPSYLSDYGNYQPQLLREYASWILSEVLNASVSAERKIYITRSKAAYRRVVNEGNLILKLKQRHFEIIDLENLSFAEQVRLFHTASLIVAPHGAGLTNLIYCKAKAAIVEILPEDYIHPCYYTLADVFGLRYFYVIAEAVKSDANAQSYQYDMNVDVEALATLLEQERLIVPDRI